MAYHQSHLRSAIAGRRHLGDASIGAKIGLSSRRSSRVVLEGKEVVMGILRLGWIDTE